MNILVIAPYGMYENVSGSFVHNQVKAFAKQGHRVCVVLPIAFGKKISIEKNMNIGVGYTMLDNVEIYYVRYLSLSSLGAKGFNLLSTQISMRLFLKKILDTVPFEIVHAHTIEFGGTLGKKIKEKYKTPLVITTHGGDTEAAIHTKEREKILSICNGADLLVAVSEKLKNKLAQLEIETPIRCVRNGFSIHNVVQEEKNPYLISQVGHLIPSKHFEDTIQAVSILKEKGVEVKLNIIGKGNQLAKLQSLCNELGIEHQVHFWGEVDNKKVFAEMAKSRFFVLPSFPEGFGIVYMEAMASECITIGTEGEGIAELITSGENGYLVQKNSPKEIADIILGCINNTEKADEIARNGKISVQQLSWEENASHYTKIYDDLVMRET